MIKLDNNSDKGMVREATIELQETITSLQDSFQRIYTITDEIVSICKTLRADYDALKQDFDEYLDNVTSLPEPAVFDGTQLPAEIGEWTPMGDGSKCWVQKTKSGNYTIPTPQVPREVIEKHNLQQCSTLESSSEQE